MALKKRDDDLLQLVKRPHAISVNRLAMVVIATIDEDVPAPEEFSDGLERFETFFSLRHHELGEYLITGSRRRIAVATNREATLPVDEADYPVRVEPFLLVVCTGGFFTWHNCSMEGTILP